MINASLADDNPFYAISLFHDIYFRDVGKTLANFRVQTSEPCRIEIIDAFSHQLLAIDANGDGDFEDIGDALYADSNGDGYPDLKLSSTEDTKQIELAVFPQFKNNREKREIEISLSFQSHGVWKTQAIDRLIVK